MSSSTVNGVVERTRSHRDWFEYHLPWATKDWLWHALSMGYLAYVVLFYFVFENKAFLYTFLPLSIGFLVLKACIEMAYIEVERWGKSIENFIEKKDIKIWFKSEVSKVSSSKYAIFFSSTYSLFSLIPFFETDAFIKGSTVQVIISSVPVISINIVVGVALYSLYRLCKIVWNIGDFEIKEEYNFHSILVTGDILSNIFSYAAVGWFMIAISGLYLAMSGNKILYLYLSLPTLLFIVLGFVLCQYPLHKRMKESKHKKLIELENKIQRKGPLSVENMSKNDIEEINQYMEVKSIIKEMPEWPFEKKSFFKTLGSAFASILPTILNFLIV